MATKHVYFVSFGVTIAGKGGMYFGVRNVEIKLSEPITRIEQIDTLQKTFSKNNEFPAVISYQLLRTEEV